MMKVLFWLLAILAIPVGCFTSFVCWMTHGLDLSCTIIGDVVCILGMFSLAVSIACGVLGIIKLRKGNVKKAVVFALLGVVYSFAMIAGIYVDDAVDTMLLDRDIARREERLYGENWNAPSLVEGIPELYQKELNKCYVAVRERWPAEKLMDMGVMAMPEYYGDVALENIGFALMDVNGNGSEELVIGTAVPAEEGGTAIFCVYSDQENPFKTLSSVEGEDEVYYLHPGEAAGTYLAEIGGEDGAWLLTAEDGDSIVGISYQEGALESANRLTLEMTPFSRYK